METHFPRSLADYAVLARPGTTACASLQGELAGEALALIIRNTTLLLARDGSSPDTRILSRPTSHRRPRAADRVPHAPHHDPHVIAAYWEGHLRGLRHPRG